MFERFTERGRQVIIHAQEEARSLGASSIGTEHVLLGLLRDPQAIAARALESFGVTHEAVRSQVSQGSGEDTPTRHQIPFTPEAKAVLDSALDEAIRLKTDYLSTEHILLGLLHETDSVAVGILVHLGLTPDAVRAETLRLGFGERP